MFGISNFEFRIFLTTVSLLALVVSCTPQTSRQDRASLAAASRSVESQQYDQAIAQADSYLAKQPHGPGSAEALYLKGRGYEGRVAHNEAEARANLQQARTCYIQALEQRPSPQTEAAIRTSLANVSYFQDDYGTALSQWTIAYSKLADPNVKAWVLYRMGICQQRLGQFPAADQTFTQVERAYPNSIPAQRSREHVGARGFYVQLATYASAATADKVAASLRGQGFHSTRTTDAKGNHEVRVGPYPSYSQAAATKSRFATQYPDAFVVP